MVIFHDKVVGSSTSVYFRITLQEWNHDKDHVHILFKAYPNTAISKFINAYKSKAWNKTFKFRIYPNAQQRMMLAKTFGYVRFIYNRMFAYKIEYYKETNQKLSNTPVQYKREFE